MNGLVARVGWEMDAGNAGLVEEARWRVLEDEDSREFGNLEYSLS